MDIIQLPPNENSKATGIFSLGKWRDFMNVQFCTQKAIAMS